MKLNKRYFLLRLISFPIKLIFSILWYLLVSIMISIKWLVHGGQELFYGEDNGENLVKIIEQNEKLIKHFENETKSIFKTTKH